MKMHKTAIAAAVAASIGSVAVPQAASAGVIIADGFYNLTINNTPYVGSSYVFGSNGAWNSSFTFGCLPGSKGCGSQAMYDNTSALTVNGKYSGVINDGVAGTVSIKVQGGVITGTGTFQIDTIKKTAGGNFAQYLDSTVQPINFTGSVDASGNLSLTPTGRLGTVGDFPPLVDERWNVDNFNGLTGTVPNPPNLSQTAWKSFSTGSATNLAGTINGAQVTSTGGGNYAAILVSGGQVGSDWGGFFGANYMEAWNVDFTFTGPLPPTTVIPVPAAAWLFGSGLVGLVGVARRKKAQS